MIPAHGNGGVDRRPARKPLAICADDFGMAPGISSGIIELARCDRLSAVSCLSR
ncbi:MAG: ChbG/HpnK family deacetylase, partial [Candidatus Accumulibacter phosphatis]|uniref:ChbG/HpnK family deacetylase n=1 Tax=Candidatus Accumulibacter phosphatis TaxID=327160 RepID=UPI001A500211|nr:ChbG/HpnK family deacetylase [Candidatus Accumulibacter phosphatis]